MSTYTARFKRRHKLFGHLFTGPYKAIVVDGTYWVCSYDSMGQVTSGRKYWADGTPVAGQHFEYAFDDIGNRKNTAVGGDQLGANLRPANYTANSLNQYSSRDVPGYVNVLGSAKTNATVSLWSTNSTGAVWMTITNLAVLQNGSNPDIVTNTVGQTFVPKTAENFYYDFDGNLTNDGRWVYTWDAENRLVRMVASTSAGPQQRMDFEFDSKGGRIGKKMWNNTAGTGSPALEQKFVYDGWNLVASLNPQSSILQSFTWGLDLSGSEQGAGGVGGLLLSRDVGTSVTNVAAYDGNGNVAALVNVASGAVSANYEYGPFGEVLRTTGANTKVNPFRFSTKYQDDESDYLYYGYRSYNPSTGRWLSRDPIEEDLGGLNLYGFVNNAPPLIIDYQGQRPLADNKTRTIVVGKCEIAIIYGHGATGRNNRNWKWKVTRSGCAAGTAVMCWPIDNTEGLDDGLNLWTRWGGEPLEFDWHTVMWGMSPGGKDWYEGLGQAHHMPNANKVLLTVAMAAINRATTICSNNKCGCKNIGVFFIEVDHHGRPMDPKKAYDGVPLVADLTVPCSGPPPTPPTCE